jgi:predicted DsbA family dithiol-disulfide isomerase
MTTSATAPSAHAAPPPGVVVFYSDIGCPWASLAVHRLRRRRSERGLDDAVRIDHRAFPLELFNEQVTPKTIVDSETAVVGSHEPDLGWQPWRRMEREYPGTTLLPLEAVQAAKADSVGGLRASEDLDAALRSAWYGASRSIHLYAELLAVAGEVASVDAGALDGLLRTGAGRAEVFAQWEDAKGVAQGSPHLFLADGMSVHNPGIELEWTAAQFHGMPRIVSDDPTVYDEILDRAGRS